jgi:hypothetical protein
MLALFLTDINSDHKSAFTYLYTPLYAYRTETNLHTVIAKQMADNSYKIACIYGDYEADISKEEFLKLRPADFSRWPLPLIAFLVMGFIFLASLPFSIYNYYIYWQNRKIRRMLCVETNTN